MDRLPVAARQLPVASSMSRRRPPIADREQPTAHRESPIAPILPAVKIRLGIIGTGEAWETRHRPALRMLHDRFDVRAVFSPVARLAENIAGEFQADVADGYRVMVHRCDIDAVLVLQRTWLGWLPMMAAAEAGKAIYWGGRCDLDPTADADVRRTIDDSGVSMMVEFPRRYAPATLRLKELIATRLGRPQMIFCHRRISCGDDLPARRRWELLELIDWTRYVVGHPVATVTSIGHEAADGTDDYELLNLTFDADPPVTANLSVGSYVPGEWSEAIAFQCPSAMQIRCERGLAFVDLPSTLVWFDAAGRHVETLEAETPVGQQLLSQFHRAVTSLLRNVGDLGDLFTAGEILRAAGRSRDEGRRVEIDR